MVRRKKKYLNNADLLREINKSKMSYCWILDKTYNNYDYIVFSTEEINSEILSKAKSERIKRLNNEIINTIQHKDMVSSKKAKELASERNLLIFDIPDEDVVIRCITREHIPEDTFKQVRTNFEPFKHYIVDNNEFIEVARSHWIGTPEDGEFSMTHGRITNELGKMFIKLAEEISHKPNYRNYTYIDEMMGDARIQLVKNALLFNESIFYDTNRSVKQLNPFAYYTSFVNNAFRSVLNTEKNARNIRDDLLEINGFNPSHTRQIELEIKMVENRNNKDESIR